MQRRGRPDGDRDQQAARHRGGQAEGDGRQRDHTTTTQRDPRVRRHGSRIGFLLPGSGAAANESANGAAAKPAEPGTPETITATCAQVDSPANRMSVLLIRRFRVRVPDAPHHLTCGYVGDQDQSRVHLPMKESATSILCPRTGPRSRFERWPDDRSLMTERDGSLHQSGSRSVTRDLTAWHLARRQLADGELEDLELADPGRDLNRRGVAVVLAHAPYVPAGSSQRSENSGSRASW